MARRIGLAITAFLLLAAPGCRQRLSNFGSFSELEEHALRMDTEFQNLHVDIKAIVFGIDDVQPPVSWKVYE